MERHILAPINKEELAGLRAGDYVYITGTIYTARDAAHMPRKKWKKCLRS